MRTVDVVAAVMMAAVLGGCNTTQLGTGSSVATGSSGEAGVQKASTELTRCERPLGTAALVEPASNAITSLQSVGLQSPTPVLRLMMAQSNCFSVVDRGAALGNLNAEQQLKQSGMLRAGSSTAKGRMITVRWLITPNVVFSNPDAGGMGGQMAGALIGGLAGAIIPGAGLVGAAVSNVNVKVKEAQTTLFLTNAQTGEQTAVAEGSASVTEYGFGAPTIAGLGTTGYTNTTEGKVVTAAYLDAFNKLVQQVTAMSSNAQAKHQANLQ